MSSDIEHPGINSTPDTTGGFVAPPADSDRLRPFTAEELAQHAAELALTAERFRQAWNEASRHRQADGKSATFRNSSGQHVTFNPPREPSATEFDEAPDQLTKRHGALR